MDLSIIIPFILEYPSIIQTIFALIEELSDENYSYEIIIVENAERDPYSRIFRKEMVAFPEIKYVFEPTRCGPIARNTGARVAKGKWLLFTDAHVIPGKNTIPLLIDTIEETEAGLVHGTVRWMGRWNKTGYHYRLYTTYKNGQLNPDWPNLSTNFGAGFEHTPQQNVPYKVACASLAYVLTPRKAFQKVRGYNPICRDWPVPNPAFPLKYWMFGYECLLHPDAHHWHLLPRRERRSKDWKQIKARNGMICAYTLGGVKWATRVLESQRQLEYNMDTVYDDVLRITKEEHQWTQTHAKYSLDEVLTMLYQQGVAGTENLMKLEII